MEKEVHEGLFFFFSDTKNTKSLAQLELCNYICNAEEVLNISFVTDRLSENSVSEGAQKIFFHCEHIIRIQNLILS